MAPTPRLLGFLALASPAAPASPAGSPAGGEGLPLGGDWGFDASHWLARRELGKCIYPELDDASLAWLHDLRRAASEARRLKQFNAQSWYLPQLTSFAFPLARYLPYHRAVVYTSGRYTFDDVPAGLDYPSSRCYDFDYDATPVGSGGATAQDPHGCTLFRRSFSRLKRLRACVVGALGRSPRWASYRRAVARIRASRTPNSSNAPNPDMVQSGDRSEDPGHQRFIEACLKSHRCVLMDAYRRADEMIKYLSFKSWASLKTPLRAWVEGKLRRTRSGCEAGGDQAEELCIEKEVVGKIAEDCLGVPRGADSMTYDQLPVETKLLERSLSCNALMWDQVHVPAAPQPPVIDAASMWDPLLADRFRGKLRFDLRTTPPVCARAAAAMAIYGQIHSRVGYSLRSCSLRLSEEKPWRQCMGSEGFNCICFELCWRSALNLLCDLAKGCC